MVIMLWTIANICAHLLCARYCISASMEWLSYFSQEVSKTGTSMKLHFMEGEIVKKV